MEEIKLKAPAKINLSLDVIGKREDGYHEVKMIMQSIKLADIIYLQKLEEKKIKLENINADLPEGKENLAYKAAELILKESEKNYGVKIVVKKNIPVAAGLGGGSTDAAAVLKGINKLYQLNLSYEKLKMLGSKIGMDVPFCLQGGTALATGKGNVLKYLPDIKSQYLVLVNPPFNLSTAEVYEQYDSYVNEGVNNVKVKEIHRENSNKKVSIKKEVPTKKLINVIKTKGKFKGNEGWKNVLEPVAEKLVKDIKDIKDILKKYETKLTMMTGSGPTIFAIVHNKKQGEKIKNNWPRNQDQVFLTNTIRKS